MRGLHRRSQILWRVDAAHAAPASPGRGLQHDRVADVRNRGDILGEGNRRARHDGDAGVGRGPTRGELVAECLERRRWRPDEDEPGGLDGASERRILRQEPVAGMDRLRPGAARGIDDGVDRQVRVARRRRADPLRTVGQPHMERVDIGIRMHRDRADAQLPAGADHADRDLSAVRDQQTLERRCRHVRAQRRRVAQSGRLPCFFGGSDCRLFSSMASAAATRARDSDGRITSST